MLANTGIMVRLDHTPSPELVAMVGLALSMVGLAWRNIRTAKKPDTNSFL
jgi:hypothetical protein